MHSYFNGYLVDEDYFADCSGGGGSTTNSVAETGGSGVDFLYPEGLNGLPVYISANTSDNAYIGKRLYILSAVNLGKYDEDGNYAAIFNPGEAIHITDGTQQINGLLVDQNPDLIAITNTPSSFENLFEVPEGKTLYINSVSLTNSILIHNPTPGVTDLELKMSPGKPIVISGGTSIYTGQNDSFNGYLVDEDYFSSAGSGSNSNGGLGESINNVSQYNDTLFLNNGNYLIIPGLSASNLHYIFNDYGTVTDDNGNVYKTLVYGEDEFRKFKN